MIKSKQVTLPKATTPKYPRLLTDRGLVVLFTSKCIGTVVSVERDYDGSYAIGYYSGVWSSDCFVDYCGDIVLSNV